MFRIYFYQNSVLFRSYVPIKDCSEVTFRPFDNLTVLITLFKGVHHKRFMLNTAIYMSRELGDESS